VYRRGRQDKACSAYGLVRINWCGCGRVWEDTRKRPYCADCITLIRTAKKLYAAAFLGASTGRRTKRRRIMSRDQWVCQICLLPIPSSAVMGNLLYGNVDHVLAQSKGGSGDDSNFQASHAVCNSIKGDKDDALIKETMREILQDIVRSIRHEDSDKDSKPGLP
jgi:hypothetical protein